MYLGGALNGVKLSPEYSSYKDISTAFCSASRLQDYNAFLVKAKNVEAGVISQNEILESLFEIRIALNLSVDGLLPSSVQKKMSIKTITMIDEALNQNLQIKSFKIKPPIRGRKRNQVAYAKLISMVVKKKNEGYPITEVYGHVAEVLNRSSVTVRREYERFQRSIKKGGMKRPIKLKDNDHI